MSKILIVEDDSEIALLERDYLEIEGLESDVVSDGESAVSAALSGGSRSGAVGLDAARPQRL